MLETVITIVVARSSMLNRHCWIVGLFYINLLNHHFEFDAVHQLGFEFGTSRAKSVSLAIELTLPIVKNSYLRGKVNTINSVCLENKETLS